MDIIIDKKGTTNATLRVNLKAEDYQPKIKEKLKEYGKKVSLKGFRPGKVPASVVEKMYGKSIKMEEINQLLSQTVGNYIKDQKLNIIGYPLPDQEKAREIDWDNQSEFDFFYDLGLIPDFKYDLSEKVNVPKYIIKTDPKKAVETLENLRRQYGKMEDADLTSSTDFVSGELTEAGDEFTTTTMIPMERVSKAEASKFLGKKVGDKIEFDIDKAFEEKDHIAHVTGLPKEEALTKKGTFTFVISGIRRSTPAELNQEFFDKIFGKDVVTTEEEFKKKFEDTISENYNREAQALIAREIRKEYLAKTNIELSAEFLKRFLLVNNDGKMTKEQLDKDFDLYQSDLKWLLIRNKIGEENDVKVDHQEVVDRTKELFLQQFGGMNVMNDEMSETMNKLAENYLTSENGKNYNRTFEDVFYTKVLKLIESKISYTEKSISVEEFEKLAQQQA